MNDRKLLIVGIDPGITAAYAVLDIDGNLIDIKSSKQLNLNQLISNALSLGKVILVGTDKSKVPHLVEDFATKFGAKVANPEEDLKVDEKRLMIKKFNADDEHQADALASALFAYKSIKLLLDRIDHFADENKKQNIKNKIKDLVITKKISIKSATDLIEKKDEETQIIESVIVNKKLSENDFLKLYDKLKKYESEIRLMRKYNTDLKNRIMKLSIEKPKESKSENKKFVDFSDKRLKTLEGKLTLKEKEIQQYKTAIKKLGELMMNIKNFHVLKKLDSLGFKEFNFKNKVLNIQANDILLVNDPNIFSNDVIAILKNKVFVIVHKNTVSRKIENELPFIFIEAKKLQIHEHEHIGFVSKKEFEIEKNKVDWIGKIVDDYTKEKLVMR